MPILTNPGLLENEGTALQPGAPVNTAPHVQRHTVLFSADDVQANIGGLPFGRGLVEAALDGPAQPYDRLGGKLPEAGGRFIGIVAFSYEVEGVLNGDFEDYEHPRGYLPNKVIPVTYKGCVGVNVATAVKPGDPVFAHVSTDLKNGYFRADAGTGGIEVPGAAWRGTAEADGIAALYIDIAI